MIHVIATIELQAGTRASFLDEFAQVVRQVRAEAGCLEYGAALDVDSGLAAQVPVRDDTVTIVEKWTDVAALTAHIGAPHMQAYRLRVKAYVIRTTLQVLAPAPAPA
jgi:quinol monooxygenase YgiN